MNPYEVLGIRPNAGREELELAYKGRRSQYHPDRYAQSDAETQRWATARMQEVNQAYAVLKDDAERSRFDRENTSRAPRPGSPPSSRPPPPTQPPVPSVTLRQVLQGYACTTEPFQKIFIAPDIPKKKLAAAIESYGNGIRPRDVVVLIDDTFFGGAKQGMLVTENEILAKSVLMPGSRYLLVKVQEISAEGTCVYINGYEFTTLNIPEKRDIESLCKRINRYIQQRNEMPTSPTASHEEQHGGYQDAGRPAGVQWFSRLRQGFYSQLEGEIQRDITRDITVARTREDWLTAELIKQLLPVSRSLERFIQRRGLGLTAVERSLLSSDQVRLEVLIYVLAIVQFLLGEEAGLDEEQITEVVAPVLLRMLVLYIIDVEGIGKRRTLRSIAKPQEELGESQFFQEFRRRLGRYGLVFKQSPESAVEALNHSIKNLSAFYAADIPALTRVKLNEFVADVVNRVLDDQALSEFMGIVISETEAALVNVLEKA